MQENSTLFFALFLNLRGRFAPEFVVKLGKKQESHPDGKQAPSLGGCGGAIFYHYQNFFGGVKKCVKV